MTDKKSILFVNGHLNVGGVERALVELLSWINYDAYDVDLLLLQGRGDYEDRIPNQVRIIEYDTRKSEGPFFYDAVYNLWKGRITIVLYRLILSLSSRFSEKVLSFLRFLLPCNNHYDIAIAFRSDLCADIVSYAVNSDKKLCWWHHGDVNVEKKRFDRLVSLWRHYDKVVTVSEGCRRMLGHSFNLSLDKLYVLPNLIDYAHICELAGSVSPYGDEKRIILISLSSFFPDKHHDNAVFAAEKLVSRGYCQFLWYLVGDGMYENEIKNLIIEKNLQDYFIMPGKLVNPYPYLKFANFFIHPSYVESQGIAVLEAMALRVPVIATCSLGTCSFLLNGKNGIVVEKGVDPLFEGIKSALTMDSNQLNSIVDEGFATVVKFFAPEIIMNSFECLINE